ncbi:hypothetical protein F4678DRAFT_104931 [Xylaria arbuscula]|nr:hypothetical protein F4678DRAFT_104931 [Xylaria arbuscula]
MSEWMTPRRWDCDIVDINLLVLPPTHAPLYTKPSIYLTRYHAVLRLKSLLSFESTKETLSLLLVERRSSPPLPEVLKAYLARETPPGQLRTLLFSCTPFPYRQVLPTCHVHQERPRQSMTLACSHGFMNDLSTKQAHQTVQQPGLVLNPRKTDIYLHSKDEYCDVFIFLLYHHPPNTTTGTLYLSMSLEFYVPGGRSSTKVVYN